MRVFKATLIPVILTLLLAGITPFLFLTTDAQEADNETIAQRVITDLWNGDNPESLTDLYADLFYYNRTDGHPQSIRPRAWNLFFITPLRQAIPDLEFTIDTLTSNKDTVVVEYTATGTFENAYEFSSNYNPFNGLHSTIDPTGNQETWSGVFIYRFEDGKIAEETWYYDQRAIRILGGVAIQNRSE